MGTDGGVEAPVAEAEQAVSTTLYSGRASVLRAQVLSLVAGVADTGALPASGGSSGVNLLTASVPTLFNAGVVNAYVVGQNDHVLAQASAANASLGLSIAGLTLGADVISSKASAACVNGAPVLSGGSIITGLTINGKAITVTGAPNQTINLLLAKVIINERTSQVNGKSGSTHTAAIRVVVAGLADVSIVPSDAGLTCADAPPPPPPPPTCTDAIKNASETDVDCGGLACGGCVNGKQCLVDGDCLSNICQSNVCVPPPPGPSCTDGVKNGGETDKDCGGLVCSPCANGLKCQINSDCQSQICDDSNTCVPPPPPAPTCFDGIKNGLETDVDCGGGTCAPCATNLHCVQDFDCVSENCHSGACAAPFPTCTDGVKNGNETDVDCGGTDCPACAEAQTCGAGSDCQSAICGSSATCMPAPTCGDGIKNGAETDVDCGGPICAACVDGKQCLQDGDCASNDCSNNGVCQTVPACTSQDYMSGQGYITSTPNKRRGNFSFYGEATASGASGYMNYSDDGTSTHFTSTDVTSYVVTGPHSRRITGHGTLRNQPTVYTYTADVTDNGSTGDVFTITLSNGYHATGTPASGDIQHTQYICE